MTDALPGPLPAPRPTGAAQRRFLMLQGPHGPFFDRLAAQIRAAGAECWRVAFNAGDEFFCSDRDRLIRHDGDAGAWPGHLDRILTEHDITDIVLYGDVRPVHAAAVLAARQRGLRLHVFEEGYLRPYWITYERGGSNGHSVLMETGLGQMRQALRHLAEDVPRPPSHWGDMRHHKFYGALYHFMVLVANGRYPMWRSHRAVPVLREFRLHLRRLVLSPLLALRRSLLARRIRRGGFPYVLVLMQLEHDASFQAHSPFDTMTQFTDQVLDEFAAAAPRHHHLVFKAHPLEDDRAATAQAIRSRAEALGIGDRVHYLPGGKLARLLDHARAAITVNSTSAQQALWRGLPVKALGRAVYDKPELVSGQPMQEFLRNPARPDPADYRLFRDYLLQTSQIPGGFYSTRSRAQALRLATDMMLAPDDPYLTLARGQAAYRQQMGVSTG